MNFWQAVFVIVFSLFNFGIFIKSLRETKYKRNPYGLTKYLFFLGIFVWGDGIILGPFWIFVGVTTLLINNWNLFLLIVSLFWTIRSFGEVNYWLNEQFAGKNRNPPHTLNMHKLFQGESIWFIYQLFWECIMVISLLCVIYFYRFLK